MLKKIILGLVLTSSLFGENELWKFFKYSTAYGSFSLNAPRFQDDRFAIVGGLSTGNLVVERTERELKPDFQTSFGLRKIGRFNMKLKEELSLQVKAEFGMMVQNKTLMKVLHSDLLKVGNI